MKSIQQRPLKAKAVSQKILGRGLLVLVSIHMLVGTAAMTIAINVHQALMLA